MIQNSIKNLSLWLGYRGYDKNNIEYKYRPGSTSGEPTIEMIKNNRTKVKLRYDNK